MDPPHISGLMDLAPMSIATGSHTSPTTGIHFTRRHHGPNAPGFVSPSRDLDRLSIYSTMDLGTAIGSSTRSNTSVSFSRRLPAPNISGFVSQSQNLDRPAQRFTDTLSPSTMNRAIGSMAIGSTTRPDTAAVPLSRWLPVPTTPDLVSQSRNLDRPAQGSIDPLPPNLRNESNRGFAQYRMSAVRARDTANGLNDDQILITHTVDGIDPRASRASNKKSNTKAETFLKSLPVLSRMDLPEGSQECPICMEQYQGPPHRERPVRLPCKHVMGKDCLQQWQKSCEIEFNNNTCPICRAVLFKKDNDFLEAQVQSMHDALGQVPELYRSRTRPELLEAVNRFLDEEDYDMPLTNLHQANEALDGLERQYQAAMARLRARRAQFERGTGWV